MRGAKLKQALAKLETSQTEIGQLKGQVDTLKTERSALATERDAIKRERDTLKAAPPAPEPKADEPPKPKRKPAYNRSLDPDGDFDDAPPTDQSGMAEIEERANRQLDKSHGKHNDGFRI